MYQFLLCFLENGSRTPAQGVPGAALAENLPKTVTGKPHGRLVAHDFKFSIAI